MNMTVEAIGGTPSRLIQRGGRMTKWRGIVASVAPQIGMALTLVVGLGHEADAGCTNAGGGTYNCTKSQTAQVTITTSGVPLTVNAKAGLTFKATSAGKSAFVLTSNRALTFTQAAGGGVITGNNSGIRATNNGTGAMAITTTGAVTGTTGAGLFLVNQGSSLTVNATDVTGFVHGINANNSGPGAVTITATGTVSGTRVPVSTVTNSTGISVNQVNGTDIMIVANNATGGTYGISANNQAGTTGGNTSVTVTGTVSGGSGAPVGASGAISALHSNSGALSINLLGTATSAVGTGIIATTSAASTTATINANTISAATDGMRLTHGGTGALTVTVTGTVAGGTGAAINNTAASKGGSFTIASGGALQSTSGLAFNDASDGSAGGAGSTLDVYGTLGGAALMGAGADTITLHSGATLASGALLDGDAGSGSFSAGKIDTLDFAGWSGYVDGAQIANQEQVLLSDSADVTFTGANLSNANAIDGLTLQTGASAIARFASNFTVSGNFTNFGALDLSSRNGTAGTTLNIGGNYLGGGQFVIDVDFATDFSDQLLVAGNVTGTTFVAVNDVSSGSASGNNVVFASVGGTTAAGDFQLAGGPLSIGAYNYDAQLLGNQWVLGTVVAAPGASLTTTFAAAAVPALNATAALYESTPDILLQSFAATPTYQQRVQQRQWLSYDRTGGSAFQGVWVRSAASWADITPTVSSSGASYDSSGLSLQAGADFNLGDWVFGLTGQYGTVDADVSNALGTGSLRGQGFGLGATASWEGTSGSYLDLQAQANRISADLSTASTGVLLNNAEMWAYAASVEAGHRFALGANRHIVPQVQLGWGKLDAGRFVDSQSSVVDLGAPESLIGRLGVAYEVSKAGADGQGRLYAIGNLLHDFSGSRDVDLAGTPLTSRSGATWAEIGLGGAIALGGSASLFAEGSYRAALNGGPSRDAYSLSVGYRASF